MKPVLDSLCKEMPAAISGEVSYISTCLVYCNLNWEPDLLYTC